MLRETYLSFDGCTRMITDEPLLTALENTFTIEFWAKPEAETLHDFRFAVTPISGAYGDGDDSRAGVGVAVGTDGVVIYEHTADDLAAVLHCAASLYDWTHIAVVYDDKVPSIYINGAFAAKGTVSRSDAAVPSGVFGGMKTGGFYEGGLKEIRVWKAAKTQAELKRHINQELRGDESGLFRYWKLDEGAGDTVRDSVNHLHGTIAKAKWQMSETPINILFAYIVPSGGIETLNRQRCYGLAKHKVNCHFLYTADGIGLQNELDTSIFVTDSDEEIKQIIYEGKYDAIVVSSDVRLAKRLRNLGYQGILIYEIQGAGINKEYIDQYIKHFAYSVVQKDCDAVLHPPTPHLVKAINTYFPAKKKFCLQNCFHTKEFHYQVYPLEKNPVIGWVGRLEDNKNWREFLLIGAEFIKENPEVKLWMFEDSTLSRATERNAFEQKLKELKISRNVEIFANQPHRKMAEYLSIIGDSGGFLCSTSKVEGFGYAVLEAMVCRCPVLSSNSDGVRNFIDHNVTGKFYRSGSIEEAVKEGKELMDNLALREVIRQNAVKHIETNFSPDKYAEEFLRMIKKLKKG